MTATIRYDQPIKNLIAELNADGKVAHTKHKKSSVTFHGSADGNLTHEDVLSVWRSRGISMQFAIDISGDVAQYVVADEYACSVGENAGNEDSIHIELVMRDRGDVLDISDETLKSAARLTGWLFVHVIDEHPAVYNAFTHDHWASVSCPGPFLDDIFSMFLEEIQGWYVYYREQQRTHATFSVVET